jgi:transcriptional regulator with XRE-family HTH domain
MVTHLQEIRCKWLLEQLVKEYGTETKAGKAIGVSQSTINKILSTARPVTFATMGKARQALGLPDSYFSDPGLGEWPDYKQYATRTPAQDMLGDVRARLERLDRKDADEDFSDDQIEKTIRFAVDLHGLSQLQEGLLRGWYRAERGRQGITAAMIMDEAAAVARVRRAEDPAQARETKHGLMSVAPSEPKNRARDID